MKEKYILYVRDKGSDRTMEFELDNKDVLAAYTSTLIEHGYAEVRAVIEEVKETEIEGVIAQLESLKDNSKSFADKDEPDSVWYRDIIALDYAIDTIKKAYQDCNPSRPSKNINQCNCNTKNEIKKVRLISNEDLKALSKTLNRCIDDTNNVLWTLGKINESLIKNLEEEI